MSRKANRGQFKVGNAGGPGRPKRAVEIDYLAALSDVVPMERWRAICERAAKDAESGDAAARTWLGKYLLGSASLVALAGAEHTRAVESAVRSAYGLTDADIFAAEVDARLHPAETDVTALARILGGESLYDRARRLAAESE